MNIETWVTTEDYRGKKTEYLLAPGVSPSPAIVTEYIHNAQGHDEVSIDIPDVPNFKGRVFTEIDAIHVMEASETKLKKVTRKIVDLSLDFPGTFTTSAVAGLVAYETTQEIWPTIGVAFAGLVGHEMLRRPFVGARHLYHQIKNPWSPAAQSTARIRREILST